MNMNLFSYIRSIFNVFRLKMAILGSQQLVVGVLILSLCSLMACTDDIDLNGDLSSSSSSSDSDAIEIYFDPGTDFSTRDIKLQTDAEQNENLIRKFRVKFFISNPDDSGNDYFLFDSPIISGSNFEKIYDDKGNELYKTTIQLGELKDNNDNKLAGQIRELLCKYPFKIAIIANMPDEARTSWFGDTKEKMTNEFKYSYLNKASDLSTIKTIHDLHFLQVDDSYGEKFKFLAKKNGENWYVSDNVSWIKRRSTTDEYHVSKIEGETVPNEIKSESNAATWIRNYWDPQWDYDYQIGKKSEAVYYDYENLWQLWIIGGSFYSDGHDLSYAKIWSGNCATWGNNWKTRNGDKFKNEWFNNGSGILFKESSFYENDGLYLIQNQDTSDDSNCIRTTVTTNNNYGIILPKSDGISLNNNEQYLPYNEDPNTHIPSGKAFGSLSFIAQNSGHLRIRYGRLNSGSNARIRIQRSTGTIYDQEITSSLTNSPTWEIKITGDPEPIFIYAPNDPIVIYAIEFISDIYLNDTNREGVPLNGTTAIAMVGVQKYDAFGTWANGETKDLRSKPVSLIRSVAKVVVNLPQEAKHVYLRCMNSGATIEPVDVSASTSETWTLNHNGNTNETDCEWFRIQSYEPWYQEAGGGTESGYKDWLSWYFGSWDAWKKDDEWKNVTVPNTNDYPQIFNPRIERSDFCEFIYTGEVNGSHRYVMYVPDKGVDDPNDNTKVTSSPKVIHIEYRYDSDNYSNNLDDNNCYRIYFTDYATNNTIKQQTPASYESYEANHANLKNHWPIMRNHIYTFNVSHSTSSLVDQQIYVQIKPWEYHPQTNWEEGW